MVDSSAGGGGGQTRDSPSGWTVDTLIQHILALLTDRDERYSQRFEAQEKATAMAISSAEKAVDKAEAATERRFDSVNEFRSQLADQAQLFMPRKESEARHDRTYDQIQTLQNHVDQIQSRLDRSEGTSKGVSASGTVLIGAISAIGTLIAIGVSLFAVFSK